MRPRSREFYEKKFSVLYGKEPTPNEFIQFKNNYFSSGREEKWYKIEHRLKYKKFDKNLYRDRDFRKPI